jgi:hypothetical protein
MQQKLLDVGKLITRDLRFAWRLLSRYHSNSGPQCGIDPSARALTSAVQTGPARPSDVYFGFDLQPVGLRTRDCGGAVGAGRWNDAVMAQLACRPRSWQCGPWHLPE